MSISGVDYAFTSNGNVYQRSKTGKRVGTALGTVGTAALLFKPSKSLVKNIELFMDNNGMEVGKYLRTKTAGGTLVNLFKNFIMHPEKLARENVFTPKALALFNKWVGKIQNNAIGKQILKAIESIAKHKAGRIGLVAMAVALPIILARGIGKIYDKIVEHSRKKQADNIVNPFEVNI